MQFLRFASSRQIDYHTIRRRPFHDWLKGEARQRVKAAARKCGGVWVWPSLNTTASAASNNKKDSKCRLSRVKQCCILSIQSWQKKLHLQNMTPDIWLERENSADQALASKMVAASGGSGGWHSKGNIHFHFSAIIIIIIIVVVVAASAAKHWFKWCGH